MSIKRLNHAVLYVRDAKASAAFYTDVLDFAVAADMGGKAIFLRADGSDNDHDLGLFSVGERGVPAHSVGLYHLAWQVHTLEELVALRARLVEAGALVGESDHGVSKSLYAHDVDGIEFEIMWAVPRADWPADIGTKHLDLQAALTRWPQMDTATHN
ncbi:MAG: VOC family protein [Actinomycetia bacterium]|nr:VOC family protein [Actinomycetes bacterium]